MSPLRYYHTLRYLKPVQLYGRVAYKLRRPRANHSPAPSPRPLTRQWVAPARRRPSMLGPAEFRFLNESHAVTQPPDWNNLQWEKLWLYNLHYFDDLNARDSDQRRSWHHSLIGRWIKENLPAAGNGWEPYPTSLRIVNWIKWALTGNDLHATALHSLAIQVRHLCNRMEYHLLGNHLFANAKALVFAGLFFEGEEAGKWYQLGLDILAREVPEEVLPDGGHFERSPMYHCIILEDMLDLVNVSRACGAVVPKAWYSSIAVMRHWLKAMCHPDGEISLFNDAAIGITPAPVELESYAERLALGDCPECGDGLTRLLPSGYLRYQHGPVIALLDVAPVGPDYLPAHAHADTLTFELSLHGQRVIVDSGTSRYGSGAERLRQRSTAAHNTVTIDGENSSEVWGGFRVARRAYPVDLRIEEGGDQATVSCAHDGYTRLAGRPVHCREWRLGSSGLAIRDRIAGRFRQAVGRFHLHPDVAATINGDGRQGELRLASGHRVGWSITGGTARMAATTYHPEFGLSLPNHCVEIEFDGPECEFRLAWA